MQTIWQKEWINRTENVRAAAEDADLDLRRRGVDERARYAVQLVIEEMMSNAIKYGFPEGGEHDISLALALDDCAVRVTLSDTGRPFNPTCDENGPESKSSGQDGDIPCRPLLRSSSASSPASPASPDSEAPPKPTVGGMGIRMVRRICSDLRYRREAGRNVVEVDIPLDSAEPLDGPRT